MKLWKPLLLILPAGLVAGVIGARLVDPQDTLTSERVSSYLAESERRTDARERASPLYAPERNSAEASRPGGYRPDLDWDQEVWPGSSGEPYGYYDDRLEDEWDANAAEGLWSTEASPAATAMGRNRSAAEQAALAAERAAEDALRAAEEPRPATGATPAQPRTPAPSPAREPRTADGDLPAIW